MVDVPRVPGPPEGHQPNELIPSFRKADLDDPSPGRGLGSRPSRSLPLVPPREVTDGTGLPDALKQAIGLDEGISPQQGIGPEEGISPQQGIGPEEAAEYDLVGEAKEDWEEGAGPVLDEIFVELEYVSEPTKQECRKLVIRIKRKGAVVISQGSTAQQSLLLNLLNDLSMLADTVDAAPATDDVEREVLEEIGKKLKKKVGPRVWAILSKLGRVQAWTVHGDVGVSIFGMLTGSGGLSITFGK
jgi:hypothetical protein